MQKQIKHPAAVFKGKEQLIKTVKIGDRITIKRLTADKNFDDDKTRTFEIVAIYPYHVIGKDVRTGLRRAISYGELIIQKREKQEMKLEALRKPC